MDAMDATDPVAAVKKDSIWCICPQADTTVIPRSSICDDESPACTNDAGLSQTPTHAYLPPYLPGLLCSIPGRLRSNQCNE